VFILLRIVLPLFASTSAAAACEMIDGRRDMPSCFHKEADLLMSIGSGSGLSEAATGVIIFEGWQECLRAALTLVEKGAFGDEMDGFDLSHEDIGDEDGVVTLMDTDDRLLPPKLSHDPEREVVDAEGGLDAAEQAAHEPLLVRCLFCGKESVDLPFSRLRSPSSHWTTLSRLASSSLCKGVRPGRELYDRDGWLAGHERRLSCPSENRSWWVLRS
jgi:hypothetical protein